MQVKPIKRSKEFHCDSSTESSNNLWDIDRDIQYKTIRREQTAAPFFNSPSLKKKFWQKRIKKEHIKDISRGTFFRRTIVKGNSSGNNLRNNLGNTFVPEHLIGCFREIFMKSSQWSFYISVRIMIFKGKTEPNCTLAGYSGSGWSRFRRSNDQRASTFKFTITIMQ